VRSPRGYLNFQHQQQASPQKHGKLLALSKSVALLSALDVDAASTASSSPGLNIGANRSSTVSLSELLATAKTAKANASSTGTGGASGRSIDASRVFAAAATSAQQPPTGIISVDAAESSTSHYTRFRRVSGVGADPLLWRVEPSRLGNIGLQNAVESALGSVDKEMTSFSPSASAVPQRVSQEASAAVSRPSPVMFALGDDPAALLATDHTDEGSTLAENSRYELPTTRAMTGLGVLMGVDVTANQASVESAANSNACSPVWVGYAGRLNTETWSASTKDAVVKALWDDGRNCVPVFLSDEEIDDDAFGFLHGVANNEASMLEAQAHGYSAQAANVPRSSSEPVHVHTTREIQATQGGVGTVIGAALQGTTTPGHIRQTSGQSHHVHHSSHHHRKRSREPFDFVLCIGDDRADEFMFELFARLHDRRDSNAFTPVEIDSEASGRRTPAGTQQSQSRAFSTAPAETANEAREETASSPNDPVSSPEHPSELSRIPNERAALSPSASNLALASLDGSTTGPPGSDARHLHHQTYHHHHQHHHHRHHTHHSQSPRMHDRHRSSSSPLPPQSMCVVHTVTVGRKSSSARWHVPTILDVVNVLEALIAAYSRR
ncbi:hypothetical protein HK405_011343, partial [Cladochytrium tenue]